MICGFKVTVVVALNLLVDSNIMPGIIILSLFFPIRLQYLQDQLCIVWLHVEERSVLL